MASKSFSFIGYPGSKHAIAKQIFSVLPADCSQLIYVEPFFGGGGAYLNLPTERQFKAYECSDLMPYAINFFNHPFTESALLEWEAMIDRQYSLDTKEGYYRFRQDWNDYHGGTDVTGKVGFVLLAHHCVNHLIRFGPHGFNQAWGGKRGQLGAKWGEYLRRRREPTSFEVKDFRRVSIGVGKLMYLDPPYIDAGQEGVYGREKNGWTMKDNSDLVQLIKSHQKQGGYWILSSPQVANGQPGALITTLLQKVSGRVVEIKKTYKASVGKHAKKQHVEAIVTNL